MWLKVQVVIKLMQYGFTFKKKERKNLIMSLLQEVYLILQGIDLPLQLHTI